MKRVNFVSLDFLTLQWFCNTLQTQHPQTQAAKELYDALEALYAGKSDSLMLELGEAIPEAASTSLVCGNLLIDSKSRRVIRDGAEIQLTPKEFDILYFLARNRGEVFTKEQIYQAVWAEEYYTADSNITVSYTHLDVYKRQPPVLIVREIYLSIHKYRWDTTENRLLRCLSHKW